MKSLYQQHRFEEIAQRLDSLRPDSPRQWGRMTPNGAVCHLSDAFKMVLGERTRQPDPDGPRFDTFRNRVIGRIYALSTPLPWPKGVPTSPGVDQDKEGSPPGVFEEDIADLHAVLTRFQDRDGRDMVPHIAFRQLTRGEWGRWGYRHMDHHLRQFGA